VITGARSAESEFRQKSLTIDAERLSQVDPVLTLLTDAQYRIRVGNPERIIEHGHMITRNAALRLMLGVVVCLTVRATAAPAQTDSTWREHEGALQAARKANDSVAYRAQLRAVYKEIGATPRIVTRFAALAIAAGDTAESTRWMGALAAMGTELDTGIVSTFAKLAGARARDALLALHVRETSDAGKPTLVFRLPDANMISEDIALDAPRLRMLVSSVRRGGVYAKRIPGDAPAAAALARDSTWGMFALGIDSAHGVLWATTAALSLAAHYTAADSGRSYLIAYDLRTGAERGRYAAPDSGAHVLGDLAIGANGAVYVSDGVGSGVYELDAGQKSLRTLVPPGVLVSPQTPALSSDGHTLFVADYSIGIAAVDLATGKVAWVAHSDSLALIGIDGMYRDGRDLIVVQNGLEPNRIERLTLDASMRRVVRATTLARGPMARSLTHATISGGWLYFLRNSGWERVADDGTMTDAPPERAPEVARVRLAP
jgi:hypothetical protein